MKLTKDMLLLVDAVANQKGIELGKILHALENAYATVVARLSGLEMNVRCHIDKESGEFELFRRWSVIENPEDIEYPEKELTLEEAKEKHPEIEVGEIIEEPLDSIESGRRVANQTKQFFLQEVNKLERALLVEEYEQKIGELIIAVVKRATRESVFLDLGGNAEAVIPREELLPREVIRPGDRVRGYLYKVDPEARGAQIFLSRTRPEMLVELFKIEVPEIGDGIIEIKSAARDPGSRAKIAVKTNDGRIDPIGACVGMRGSRVQAVSSELGGERVDIVLWDDNPAQLVINAMAPAEIASIVVDEEKKSMDIAVEEEYLSQAIGRGGQNVRLASLLTGWTLNVMSVQDAETKQQEESKDVQQQLMEQLKIDEEVASALVEEGFSSVEEVAYIAEDEFMEMEGFDEAIVKDLQSRAKDFLLTKAIATEEQLSELKPEQDLFDVDGMNAELAIRLAKGGVKTRDDLAELSVDDLLEVIPEMSPDDAAKMIMAARAHWFTEA